MFYLTTGHSVFLSNSLIDGVSMSLNFEEPLSKFNLILELLYFVGFFTLKNSVILLLQLKCSG